MAFYDPLFTKKEDEKNILRKYVDFAYGGLQKQALQALRELLQQPADYRVEPQELIRPLDELAEKIPTVDASMSVKTMFPLLGIPDVAKTIIPMIPRMFVDESKTGFLSPSFLEKAEKLPETGWTGELTEPVGSLAFMATAAPVETSLSKMSPGTARSILKTGKNASPQEINTAYRSLAKKEFPRTLEQVANRYKTNAANLLNTAKEVLLKEQARTQITPLLAGKVTKPTAIPKGLEPLTKEVKKKTAKESLERLKHLLTYNDTLKRKYNLSDKELAKIDYKKAREIFETLPKDKKDFVLGESKRIAGDLPLPDNELRSMFKEPGMDIKKKVNIIDYLRTPEQVLDKIGLVKEKKAIRFGYDNYQEQLREEFVKIGAWKERTPRKDSAQTIFDYLDGKLDAKTLNKEELKVANEIKVYLKKWAFRLNLPEEKQISNYITHLFERTKEGVEFPVDIARKIKGETAGSVYDPFLAKRTGKPGYVRDVWRALEVYVKRGTRKESLDPALAMLKKASENLDPETEKYIRAYSHRINLRPTDIDTLLDNLIKQSPIGYKFTERPTAYLTNWWRKKIYRGALGLNVGSAMRNLSQGVNTYAVLGEKYTALGYAETVKHLIRNDFDELAKHNVLLDDIIIDREFHITKKVMQKMDDVLYTFFDFAEKINRSSAYFGAKKQALDKGKSIPEAIDYAKGVVRRTQFTYNQIDQPVALASDLAKAFTQFQSYPLKQAEFLGKMIKDRNFVGLIRYIIGALVLTATYGKLFGMDLGEFIPFSDARFTSPAGETIGALGDIISTDERRREEGKRKLSSALQLLIPGGVQLKKTLQGAVSGARGYTATPTGRARYPVGQDPMSALQLLLFGQYAVPEAREYYKLDRKPLGEKQTEKFEKYGLPYYEKIMRERESK